MVEETNKASQWRMPIAVEEKKGTKFEIDKQMKGAEEERKKTKEEDEPFWKEKNESAEEEACWEGDCWVHERRRKARKKKMFFLKKYINFYFLNEGYFWKFIELLGAPSNTPHITNLT